jgi:hypothetical protein
MQFFFWTLHIESSSHLIHGSALPDPRRNHIINSKQNVEHVSLDTFRRDFSYKTIHYLTHISHWSLDLIYAAPRDLRWYYYWLWSAVAGTVDLEEHKWIEYSSGRWRCATGLLKSFWESFECSTVNGDTCTSFNYNDDICWNYRASNICPYLSQTTADIITITHVSYYYCFT